MTPCTLAYESAALAIVRTRFRTHRCNAGALTSSEIAAKRHSVSNTLSPPGTDPETQDAPCATAILIGN